jgi:hypothetical protein
MCGKKAAKPRRGSSSSCPDDVHPLTSNGWYTRGKKVPEKEAKSIDKTAYQTNHVVLPRGNMHGCVAVIDLQWSSHANLVKI